MHNAADYDALTELFMSDEPLPQAGQGGHRSHVSEADLPAIPLLPSPKLKIAQDLDQLDAAAWAESRATNNPSHIAPVVEALILGHLPVLGAAWVTQYAKFVAEAAGSNVALLRAHEGQAWLDIVQPSHAPSIEASDEESGEPLLLASAERAGSLAARWIIRVDDCNEPDLVALPQLDTITLLTGADDPAILASYRTIKQLAHLAESMGRPLAKEVGGNGLRMQLVIMGADVQKAAEADAKIRRSALAFLGHALAPAMSIAKISPCGTVALYRGEATASVSEVLQAACSPEDQGDAANDPPLSASRETVSREKPSREQAKQATARDTFTPTTLPALTLIPAAPKVAGSVEAKPATSNAPPPPPLPKIVLPQASISRSKVSDHEPSVPQTPAVSNGVAPMFALPDAPPAVTTSPAPRSRQFDSRVVASAPAPSVASLVHSDGAMPQMGVLREVVIGVDALALLAAGDVPSLRAITVACPYAKGVVFGIDAAGTMHAAAVVRLPGAHALATSSNATGSQGAHADEASAMAGLQTAKLWASEHHALLQGALRGMLGQGPLHAGGLPALLQNGCVMHLLTPNNNVVRDLMHAPVRVHLLVRAGAVLASARVL